MQAQFDCVGRVFRDGKPHGSCVLIDKNNMLTAAHIFFQHGHQYGDTNNYNFLLNGKKYRASAIIIHPIYLETTAIPKPCDIALVRLTESVRDVAPTVLNTEFDELNSDVVIVGYGLCRPSLPVDAAHTAGEKLAGQNVVDSISGFELNGHKTMLTCDFDSPSDSSVNKTGSPIPTPLEYAVNGGDSGGGVFREMDGQWQLIGINSHGRSYTSIKNGFYGSVDNFTRVAAFAPWVQRYMKDTGQ